MPPMSSRFPFSIDRTADGVVVAMHCDGLVRARSMSIEGLEVLVEACQQIRQNVIAALAGDSEFQARVPRDPDCICIAECKDFHGVCDVSVVASKSGDAVEFCTAFYDVGDEEAPALILIDGQLDDFLDRAAAFLSSK